MKDDATRLEYLERQNRFLSDQLYSLIERLGGLRRELEAALREPARLHEDLTRRQGFLDAATAEVERLRVVVEQLRGELDLLRKERDEALARRQEVERAVERSRGLKERQRSRSPLSWFRFGAKP